MKFNRKDLISIKDLSEEEILYILTTAETMKLTINQKRKPSYLQGKTVIKLFNNKGSRNELSFELATKYLGGNLVDMETNKGDYSNILDIGTVIDQMGGDFVIIKSPMSGSAKLIAEHINASVINAGDGYNENPSQSLLDLFTIKTQKGYFKNLKVAIIGDIIHSGVTKSNIWGLLTLGAHVSLASTPTLIPKHIEKLGVSIYYNPFDAVKDCDVILSLKIDSKANNFTKLIPSLNEYKHFFKIDSKLMSYAKEDAIIMHPGPIDRGIEISSEIIDSSRCIIDDQISTGIAVRMAILYLLSIKGGVNYEIAY